MASKLYSNTSALSSNHICSASYWYKRGGGCCGQWESCLPALRQGPARDVWTLGSCGWPRLTPQPWPPCHRQFSWGFVSHTSSSQVFVFHHGESMVKSCPWCLIPWHLHWLSAYRWPALSWFCLAAQQTLSESVSHCIRQCWSIHHLQLLIKEGGDFSGKMLLFRLNCAHCLSQSDF